MRPMPGHGALDAGFVGTSLFDAAGLPMSPMLADLVRLSAAAASSTAASTGRRWTRIRGAASIRACCTCSRGPSRRSRSSPAGNSPPDLRRKAATAVANSARVTARFR
jgi:hypothetical protein